MIKIEMELAPGPAAPYAGDASQTRAILMRYLRERLEHLVKCVVCSAETSTESESSSRKRKPSIKAKYTLVTRSMLAV